MIATDQQILDEIRSRLPYHPDVSDEDIYDETRNSYLWARVEMFLAIQDFRNKLIEACNPIAHMYLKVIEWFVAIFKKGGVK